MIKKHEGDEGNRKKLPSQKVEPESKHMAYISGMARGTVGPNSTYRADARKRLKNLGIYDNEGNIKKGIAQQNNVKTSSNPDAEINKRVEFFKFDAVNTRFRYDYIFEEVDDGKGGVKKKKKKVPGSGSDRDLLNFSDAGVPYGNHAHHILCCEAFSEKKGWTADLIGIVKDTTYDINNDFNVIYLPTVYGKAAKKKTAPTECLYHNLPNHGKGHSKYNKQVVRRVLVLKKTAKKASKVNENCDMKKKLEILDELYKQLLIIEDKFLQKLIQRGANVTMAD